jgi:hypothetical protein
MELNFTADRFITPEEYERVVQAQENPATTRLISFDMTKAAAPAEEAPKLETKSSPKKPSFMDDDDGEDDEEEALPEPVKRPSKKAAPVEAPTGSLAAVVSDWADDDEED